MTVTNAWPLISKSPWDCGERWRIKPTIKIQISGGRPIDWNENT